MSKFEAPVYQQELPSEEKSRCDSPPQGAVPLQYRLPAHCHPDPNQNCGPDRPDTSLQDRRDAVAGNLDGHLLQGPTRAKYHQYRHGGEV